MGLSQEQRDRIARAKQEAPIARAREQETKNALQTAQSREQQRLNRALQAQQSRDLRLQQGSLATARAEIETQKQIALAYGGGSAAVAEANRRLAALGGTGGAPSRSDWRSKVSYADPATLSQEQDAAIRAYAKSAPALQPPAAPGLAAPTAYGDPAARARESEQRRMMQQYASKEYWNTEQGKAMKDLALQDKYKGDNLAGYYAAQRALGEGSIDEIIQGMGYTGAMAEWARANKGMALREYMKKFPAGQPTMGGGVPSAPTVDQVKPTVGEQALMNAKYALYDGAPVAPGVTVGNEPGMVAGVNRGKMAELQAIVPQAKSTGAGEGAFNMQPQSAATTGYQLPAGAVGEFNMPEGADEFTKLVNAKIWRNRNELAGLPTVGGYQGQGLF